MQLRDVGTGRQATVISIDDAAAYAIRLAELGIRPGVHIECVQRCSGGGRVVRVGNARLALDKAALAAIVVTERTTDVESASEAEQR